MREDRRLTTDATPQLKRIRSRPRSHEMEPIMQMLSLARFFRRRRTYRTVLKELSSYSTHELHDIGIDRADIHTIARQMSQEQQ